MVVKIANLISFRQEDGMMWSINEPDRRVSLTTIPTRLFAYLLENPGKIISREEILDNTWTTYGLEPSNNSINQYISLIRSSLNELGCDQEIIKTIPRAGFYISDNIITYEHIENIKSNVSLNKDHIKKKGLIDLKHHNRQLILTSCLISALLFLQPILTFAGVFNYSFPKSILFKAGGIENCSVYSLNYISTENVEDKIKLAKIIADTYAPCVRDGLYIFHPSVQYVYNGSGRFFITQCLNSDKSLSKLSLCKATYVFKK